MASRPFDVLAARYDAEFSNRLPATWLRQHVYERITPLIAAGDRVIELGCGTGEDAIWFAQRGCDVWAVDLSASMLRVAESKIVGWGLQSRITLKQLDVAQWQPADVPNERPARLVFSNFGVLNCLHDLRPVFRTAGACLAEGGVLAICLMGRFCLSETLWFTARGQFAKAGRRWRARSQFEADGLRQAVWYHSAGELRRQAVGFRQRDLIGIGGLLPCSDAFGVCERWPRLFHPVAGLDRRFGRLLAPISDHYLLLLEKQGAIA